MLNHIDMPDNNDQVFKAMHINTIRDYLFHFTTKTKALKIISTRKFILSPLVRTNDPRETEDPTLIISWGSEKTREEAFEELQQRKNKCRDIRSRIFLGCFAKSFSHPRMFSQYTNRHKGICLAFNKNLFLQNAEEQLNGLGDIKTLDIIYDNFNLPPTDCYEEDEILKGLSHKHRDWEGEDEFRLIFLSKQETKNKPTIKFESSLFAVFAGHEFRDFEMLRNKANGIKIYHYFCLNGDFSFDEQPSREKLRK